MCIFVAITNVLSNYYPPFEELNFSKFPTFKIKNYLCPMFQKKLPALFFLLTIFSLFFACKKDEFETSGNVKLTFSEDTVLFDTVFASVGSATQVFTVYNSESKAINISSISLATGSNSNFRMNVDGRAGKSISDVEIGANDSIFIFVEVTVDPFNQNTPFVIADSILFNVNGNVQDLDLVAWGQNAHFHNADPNSPDFPFFTVSGVWDNDLPHVIYGYPIVDSAATLTINPGTQIYFHPSAAMIVYKDASLHVNGTQANPVIIQGDRLGVDYADVPGQWDRIWLYPGSKNSIIRNAIIKNGNVGLQVDTVAGPNDSTLYMENVIVKTMTSNALLLRGSTVSAYNCVFANTGSNTVNIIYGGNYKFYNCTMANYWQDGTRQDPVLFMNNYYLNFARPLNAYFGNCIVNGANDQEIGLDSFPQPNKFNFLFNHALLKVENVFSTSTPFHYNSVTRTTFNSNSPGFKDVSNNEYMLDSLNSSALDHGDMNILNAFPSVLNTDLIGTTRPQRALPDLGAYERQ